MRRTFFIALRTTAVTLLVTGVAYPLVVTGVAQLLFPWRASGSLVPDEHGRIVGSEQIAQRFSSPAYFQPRPSAAGTGGYDAASSSGSNLGPTSARLRDRVAGEIARLRAENPEAATGFDRDGTSVPARMAPARVPAELVTASASGLDPHLSPAAALWQAPRIARARGLAPDRIVAVVESHIEGRDLGFLGEARVNVLLLNLALDRRFGKSSPLSRPTPVR